MKKHLLLFFFYFLLQACVKDKPQNAIQTQVQLSSSKKVYIVNEGPFQPSANGSISLYDPASGEVIENFYKAQNNSEPGNVVQSMTSVNGNFYIVVNNSKKIVVCNDQLKKTGEINGLNSPRYLLPVTNQKAYVSDLYANGITVVNLVSNTKTAVIRCSGWTEKMVLLYNKVFVTNMRKTYVYVINTLNDAVEDSVFVGPNAGNIVVDKYDNVWVLGSGDAQQSIPGRMTKINPISNQVEAVIDFKATDLPGNLCMNRTKDTLYFLNSGIYRMAISDNGLPSSAFINPGTRNFYGLGINPNDYTIYTADALDYSQRSAIYVFNAAGNQINVFKAGIISNGFYFE